MIEREQMMAPMLEACPSFQPTWQEFIEHWQDEPELPIYLALGDLARHLASMLAAGQTDSFPAIFRVVERWHTEGDHYVREAASIGLLEDLQNANMHTTTEPEQFRKFLLPESERWWNKVHAFWAHGTRIADD